MRRTAIAAAVAVVAALALGPLAAPAQAYSPPEPGPLTAVSAGPGPGAGEVTFHWSASGSNTTYFRVETGLTLFGVDIAGYGADGRDAHYFYAPGTARSLTLTAAQVAAAGAPAASANHLYYRFSARDANSSGISVRNWPFLGSVAPRPPAATSRGASVKVATWNVRSAHATTGYSWLHRLPAVAAAVMAHQPGVIAMQELDVGRSDGQPGSTTGTLRQDTSLIQYLARHGGGEYKLVRSTPYVNPSTTVGTQGERILYNSATMTETTHCFDTTNGQNWSDDCRLVLPMLPGDSSAYRRFAGYARFQQKSSGRQFWLVSVHLDSRQSSNLTLEKTYNLLRWTQMEYILNAMHSIDPAGYPIVIAGDYDSWQNNPVGFGAHDALVAHGYFDTAAAAQAYYPRYTTYNALVTTLRVPSSGFGARLDTIMVKGIRSAAGWVDFFKKTNTDRPSDHNLLVTTFRLP